MHSSNLRTVIVTGANKGIGYCIVEKILRESSPYDVILTARNQDLGEEAYKTLSEKYKNSTSKLTFQQLNLSDAKSISVFIDWLKQERGGTFDVLVNNAGYGFGKNSVEDRLATININFLDTIDLTEKLLPYLTDDGKVIMVSSTLGLLSGQGKKIQQTLSDSSLTRDNLIQLTKQLLEKTKTSSQTELGFSDSSYDASKALLNAYTRFVLVKQLKETQQGYTICPGWCRTDMGGSNASNSAESGADTPVYLINLPFKRDDAINGKFLSNRKVKAF